MCGLGLNYSAIEIRNQEVNYEYIIMIIDENGDAWT